MFVRNYSDIVRYLNSKSPVDLSQYGFQYEEDLSSLNGSDSIECTSGWNYDRKMFPNTIVMEWDLVCNKDFYTTIGLVLFGVGGLVGNYVFGYLQGDVFFTTFPRNFIDVLMFIIKITGAEDHLFSCIYF